MSLSKYASTYCKYVRFSERSFIGPTVESHQGKPPKSVSAVIYRGVHRRHSRKRAQQGRRRPYIGPDAANAQQTELGEGADQEPLSSRRNSTERELAFCHAISMKPYMSFCKAH